tara:strand:+ start:3546 stop:3836 length:291 start_codon:yes stop_codon:yes gene_type:complete
MKISFKEINDGVENEIYVQDQFIGSVKLNVWSGKWKLNPSFRAEYGYSKKLKEEFSSSYKAGKSLASLFLDSEYQKNLEDTEEIDVKGYLFNKWGP